MPLHLEDLAAGQTVVTPGRTITEADVVAVASWTNDGDQVHTEAESATGIRYGRHTGIVEHTVTLRDQDGRVVQHGRADLTVLTREAAIG